MDETFDRNHLLKPFALNEQTRYSQEWNKYIHSVLRLTLQTYGTIEFFFSS